MIKSLFGGRKEKQLEEQIEEVVDGIEEGSELSTEEFGVSEIEMSSYYEQHQEGKTAFKLTYELRKEDVTTETLNQLNFLLLKEANILVEQIIKSNLNSSAAEKFFKFVNLDPNETSYNKFTDYLLLKLTSSTQVLLCVTADKITDGKDYEQKDLLQITEVFGTIDTIWRLLGLQKGLVEYRNSVIELIPTAKELLQVKSKNKKYDEIMGMVDDFRKVLES